MERGVDMVKVCRVSVRIVFAIAASALLMTLGAPLASADSVTSYTFGGGPVTGPITLVTVDLTSATTAAITFTYETGNGNICLMGGNGAVAVNVNGAYTLGTVTESNAGTGFTPPTYIGLDSGTEGSWGKFNLALDNSAGFKDSADKVSFTITDTSGTWASAGNVLITNASGQVAADHVYVTSSPANSANGATVSGYAAVPEPAILMELGVLLLGLGLLVSLGVLRPRIAL